MKKKLVLLLYIIPILGFSTKAPDFTVTDYNNKIHKLYADYLNKEKVVVLKIFFVDCPPCNSIAPLMQPIYTKWGAGNGRVQFFEMTTMSFDNNAYVKTYADKYGITFPGIGSDGGALTAVAPYKDNKTFGSWYGTPTFVVIAPNGEVNYGIPFGKSNTVLLDTAIAQALRIPSNDSGGGSKCKDSFQIKVFNPYSSNFKEKVVTFDLYNSGNPKYDLLNGLYNCEFFYPAYKDNYVVGLEIPSSSNLSDLEGISTQDILLIQKYILGIKPLNNLQLVLGDVNNNGVVSSSDISEIRKLILGVIPSFKVGKFYGYAHNPKGLDNKGKTTVLVNDIISKKAGIEFGIGHFGDLSTAEKIGLAQNIHDRTQCDQNFKIKISNYTEFYEYEISSLDNIEILSLQMSFLSSFTDCYNFAFNVNLAQNSTDNYSITNNGSKFNFLWTSPTLQPISLISGEKILSFKSKKLIQSLKFGKQEIVLADESVCNINYTSISNYNPQTSCCYSNKEIFIESSNDISEILLYNLNGTMICSKNFSGKNLNKVQVEFPIDCYQEGIYFVKTNLSNGNSETHKISVVK